MFVINPANNISKTHTPKYLSIFIAIFTSSWLISNILAVKMLFWGGIFLTGGFLTFPFTVAINSLIVEIYGYKSARQALWAGCMINLSYIFFIHIINILPEAPGREIQDAFQLVLIPSTRVVLASLISFCLSGFFNSYLIAKFKCSGKSLLFRILISSFLAISLDLTLFFGLGFLGSTPILLLKKLFLCAYLKKITCEIILLPALWILIDFLKEAEGFEIQDTITNFSPFSLDNVYDFNFYKDTGVVQALS